MAATLSIPFLLAFFLLFYFQPCVPDTIVVDDASAEWKIPTLHVGDSIVFKHKGPSNLYIFRTERAYDHCIFAQATLLSRDKSSTYFTWHPSRPGDYYFSLSNGSHPVCNNGEKIRARVIIPELLAPSQAPQPKPGGDLYPILPHTPIFASQAPPPTPGGDFYPTLPHARTFASPSPTPEASQQPGAPLSAPSVFTGSGGSIPFISSNPAVPLPTGQTDSNFIHPLPITGDGNGSQVVRMGSLRAQVALLLLVFLATTMASL